MNSSYSKKKKGKENEGNNKVKDTEKQGRKICSESYLFNINEAWYYRIGVTKKKLLRKP
jgi:hypothetical protein